MKDRLMLISSMVAFGTIGVFVKSIGLSSALISLSRAILAAVVIVLFKIVTKSRFKLKGGLVLFISGAAMGFNWVLLFEAYKYTSVSIATLCYYFSPVIVTVLSSLIFKEKLSLKKLICFIFSTAGLVLIIMPNNGQVSSIKGILLGLGAAVLYAAVILLNKGLKDYPGIDRTLMQFLSAIIVLSLYIAFTEKIDFSQVSVSGWINLLIVGFLHTGLCYCLYFTAMRSLKGQEIAVLSYIDPLVAVLCSFFVLGESMTSLQILGGLLILGFAVLNEVTFSRGKGSRLS